MTATAIVTVGFEARLEALTTEARAFEAATPAREEWLATALVERLEEAAICLTDPYDAAAAVLVAQDYADVLHRLLGCGCFADVDHEGELGARADKLGDALGELAADLDAAEVA